MPKYRGGKKHSHTQKDESRVDFFGTETVWVLSKRCLGIMWAREVWSRGRSPDPLSGGARLIMKVHYRAEEVLL